jgi:hypothetical protein
MAVRARYYPAIRTLSTSKKLLSPSPFNDGLTIVTGASSNHFNCLCNLLYTISVFENDSRDIVYDLGLLEKERAYLLNLGYLTLRTFDFSAHPEWMTFRRDGDKAARCGCYAWKPIILLDAVLECGGLVLWLDAGILIHRRLNGIRQALQDEGLYCPTSSGSIRQWTHPQTLSYLNVTAHILEKQNRAAGMVGFCAFNPVALHILKAWRTVSSLKECIAPPGATIYNHRYDQALLGILLYQYQELHKFSLFDQLLDLSSHHNDRRTLEEVKNMVGFVD